MNAINTIVEAIKKISQKFKIYIVSSSPVVRHRYGYYRISGIRWAWKSLEPESDNNNTVPEKYENGRGRHSNSERELSGLFFHASRCAAFSSATDKNNTFSGAYRTTRISNGPALSAGAHIAGRKQQ